MKRQLLEQINRFETRTETKNFLVGEVADYLRKRADLETQYAKDLEKLSERLEKNITRDPGVRCTISIIIHLYHNNTILLFLYDTIRYYNRTIV